MTFLSLKGHETFFTDKISGANFTTFPHRNKYFLLFCKPYQIVIQN